MCGCESLVLWDITDIKMAIKRYFYKLDRKEYGEASLEIEFLRSIHREWSYHPLMRRADPATIAIIDDFLRWIDATPIGSHLDSHFTIRRLLH
jgi:hypothetical protein